MVSMALIRFSLFFTLSMTETAVWLISSSRVSRLSTVEIPFSRRKSIAACTLLKSATVPLSFPLEVQPARCPLRSSKYCESSSGMVGSFVCSNASIRAAFFSFKSAIQPFKWRTIWRMDCMRELAALMSRFRLPMLVWIPFFSIWQAAGPMWTVGILSIPCRA